MDLSCAFLECARSLHFTLLLVSLFKTQSYYTRNISSVISQKGESLNGCFKKTKHAKFSQKQTLLTPWYAHVHVCMRVCVFENNFTFREKQEPIILSLKERLRKTCGNGLYFKEIIL